MEIVLFVLGVIGITHILADGKIFQPVRDWLHNTSFTKPVAHMLSCYQCCGTWVGFLCGWLVFSNITWGQVFVAGGAGSFLASFAATFLNYLEASTVIHIEEETK